MLSELSLNAGELCRSAGLLLDMIGVALVWWSNVPGEGALTVSQAEEDIWWEKLKSRSGGFLILFGFFLQFVGTALL